jgi:DNA-binding MarR family transcriptional regulator
MMTDQPSAADYRALADFRHQLRRFLAFSETSARAAGLEPQQHQVLLAIKGLPTQCLATIATLADRLQIQHQSAVELVDRLEAKGLVHRTRDQHDRRRVLISLTETGEEELAPLVNDALRQLTDTGSDLLGALRDVITHATRY